MYKMVSRQSKGEAKPETCKRRGITPKTCCQNSIVMQEKALGVPRSLFSNLSSFVWVSGNGTTVRTVCQDDFHGTERCLVRIWKPRTKTPLLSEHGEEVSKGGKKKGGGGPGRLYHQSLRTESRQPWSAASPYVGTSSWSAKTHWTNHFL